jgi:hypothetical protein
MPRAATSRGVFELVVEFLRCAGGARGGFGRALGDRLEVVPQPPDLGSEPINVADRAGFVAAAFHIAGTDRVTAR